MITITALQVASRGRLLSRFSKTKIRPSPSRFQSSVRASAAEEQDEEWEYPTAQQQKALAPTPSPPLSLEAPRQRETDDSADEPHVSPSDLLYAGNQRMPITSTLHIVTPEEDVPRGIWPVFRLMVRRLFVHLSCSLSHTTV